MHPLTVTTIGGPTALIELGGIRLLTDPTFDGPGEYRLPHVTLKKTSRPALAADRIGAVDAVLLGHDQHADNLDRSGRAFLQSAGRVFTTPVGARRLGGHVEGLRPWERVELEGTHGCRVRITATPARHGPPGIEPLAGKVTGFVIGIDGASRVYVTGDTVWYASVEEVARRFPADVVLLFAGAARTRGPFNLTMNVNDAVETAHAFPHAAIVPVHCEGWAHFSEDVHDLEATFEALGLRTRLRVLEPGVATGMNPG